MPFVPNLSTPYLEIALQLCFSDAVDDESARQDLFSQYAEAYASIGRSLHHEWLQFLQRGDATEARDLVAYAVHKAPPLSEREALDWLQLQFDELSPLWQRLGCASPEDELATRDASTKR